MKKRTWKLAGAFLLLVLTGAGGYTWYLYDNVHETMDAIYEPIEPLSGTDLTVGQNGGAGGVNIQTLAASGTTALNLSGGMHRDKPVDLNSGEPFTLMFLGVDERSEDVGRSDSIMVLGVNPEKHSVLMFNIPRDTRTEIIGKGKLDKINHAYAFGGVSMSVHTVENFLNIPIDYYVKVNMEGFANIIDILGGVEADNPFEFTYEGVTYPQGKVSLDGHNALMFSRMRYDDPKGDIGRNARQQSILSELIGRAKRVSTVTKLPEILDQIRSNAKTNLTMDDMQTLYDKYRQEMDTVTKDEVQGGGERIDGIYYYQVTDQERSRIHDKLAEQLK